MLPGWHLDPWVRDLAWRATFFKGWVIGFQELYEEQANLNSLYSLFVGSRVRRFGLEILETCLSGCPLKQNPLVNDGQTYVFVLVDFHLPCFLMAKKRTKKNFVKIRYLVLSICSIFAVFWFWWHLGARPLQLALPPSRHPGMAPPTPQNRNFGPGFFGMLAAGMVVLCPWIQPRNSLFRLRFSIIFLEKLMKIKNTIFGGLNVVLYKSLEALAVVFLGGHSPRSQAGGKSFGDLVSESNRRVKIWEGDLLKCLLPKMCLHHEMPRRLPGIYWNQI